MFVGGGWSPGVIAALEMQVFADREGMSSGVLVGVRNESGVRVDAVIPAVTGARIAVEPLDGATWGSIHETLVRVYAGREIVGWYVARPGLRAALTAADVEVHDRFFPGQQILLAVDSRTGETAGYGSVPGGIAELQRGWMALEAGSARDAPRGATRRSIRRPVLLGVLIGFVVWLVTGADGGVLARQTRTDLIAPLPGREA